MRNPWRLLSPRLRRATLAVALFPWSVVVLPATAWWAQRQGVAQAQKQAIAEATLAARVAPVWRDAMTPFGCTQSPIDTSFRDFCGHLRAGALLRQCIRTDARAWICHDSPKLDGY
jgi:hypothetical protein